MEALLLGLAVLACPVGMGVMMWAMMRGSRSQRSESVADEQVARLRAEVDQLRQTQAVREQAGGQPPTEAETARALTLEQPAKGDRRCR